MNLSSFEGGNDINQYRLTGTLDGRQSLVGGYNNGHYVNTESSLQIRVQRQTYKNKKGKGELTGFWSYIHANKGFINFNKATPVSENGKKQIVLTGGIYFLERTNQHSSWTIKYKKEVKKEDNKFLDKSNFNKHFPKPYGYTQEGGFDKYGYTNGGFIDGAKDIDNICADNDNECSGSQQSSSSALLKWKGRGGDWYDQKCEFGIVNRGCDHIYEGSGDSNSVSSLQGFDHMYGNIGNTRLEDHLNHVYKGAWKPVK